MYVHLVDLGDVSPEYCEYAQPVSLLRRGRDSVPVACLPLTYRAGEGVWVHNGKSYTRLDNLAEALAKAVETWSHWCKWAPVGSLPPAIYDVELLHEALRRMPVYRPPPEELAIDYASWVYGNNLASFLHSEYIHKLRARRASAKWREICEHDDPRACYHGELGELLALLKEQGKTPAVDSVLFGRRFARPWGAPPVSHRVSGRTTYVYYVLGHILREVLARAPKIAGEESPWLTLDTVPDVQAPIMHEKRRRKTKPFTPIEPVEDFPSGQSDVTEGDPFAAFNTLDLR